MNYNFAEGITITEWKAVMPKHTINCFCWWEWNQSFESFCFCQRVGSNFWICTWCNSISCTISCCAQHVLKRIWKQCVNTLLKLVKALFYLLNNLNSCQFALLQVVYLLCAQIKSVRWWSGILIWYHPAMQALCKVLLHYLL